MENMFNNLINFLLLQNDIILYLFLLLSAVIENLLPPIPGDTITVLGAFLVGAGRLNYFIVYITTTTGSVAGYMLLFIIGKFLGKKYFFNKKFKYFSIEKIERSEKWIEKYGYWIIVSNRFLPGIRSVISIASGISNLNTFKVFIFSMISALIWNFIWIHTGFLLGDNWEAVKINFSNIMKNYNIIAGILIIIIIIIIILKIKRKKLKLNKSIDKKFIIL